MKVNKEKLDSVDANQIMGQIICCAMYLDYKNKHGAGNTIHEQVAVMILHGKGKHDIVRKTGFEEKTVHDALLDIAAWCGARE